MKKKLCPAMCLAGAVVLGAGDVSAQEAPPPAPPPAPAPAPPPAPEPAPAPAEAAPHTVAAGEHLWGISDNRLGNGERWVEIYVLNRDALQNPNQINVGQVLTIPSAPVPVPPDVLTSLSPAPSTRRSTGSSATSATSTWSRSAPSASRSSHSSSGSRNSTDSRSSSGSGGGGGGDLARIRNCESGGDYSAVSGPYRGAYQFDQQTWESVGGTGDPAGAAPAEQDARASRLRAQRGSNPWPNCG